MKSINLRHCKSLIAAYAIRDESSVSDECEVAFIYATAGFPERDIELIREFSKAAVTIRTMGELWRASRALGNCKAGQRLRKVLRRIGQRNRERLDQETINVHDLLRSMFRLLYSVSNTEMDGLVAACVRYGREVAAARLEQISSDLKGSPEGEALRHGLLLTDEPFRHSAKRAGVSHVAIAKMAARIEEKL